MQMLDAHLMQTSIQTPIQTSMHRCSMHRWCKHQCTNAQCTEDVSCNTDSNRILQTTVVCNHISWLHKFTQHSPVTCPACIQQKKLGQSLKIFVLINDDLTCLCLIFSRSKVATSVVCSIWSPGITMLRLILSRSFRFSFITFFRFLSHDNTKGAWSISHSRAQYINLFVVAIWLHYKCYSLEMSARNNCFLVDAISQ